MQIMNIAGKINLRTVSMITLLVALVAVLSMTSAQESRPNGVVETYSHRFTPIADGIWQVTGTGRVNVISNSMLIEGLNDLLLVDSHVTPNAGLALLESVKAISHKPVRYLVNTHYHFDHAHGNQVFPDDVEIIGHQYTRDKLSGELGNVLEESTFISFTEGVPGQIAALQAQLDNTSDEDERAALQAQIAVQQAHLSSLAETEPTPPNITIDNAMRIYQDIAGGGREIQLLYLGRGHTGGDVVLFLPEEKIVFSGDLMVPSIPYMGDAHVDEWPDTLEKLKALDFDTLLPGHGPVVQGKERINHLQAYLRDLWSRSEALKDSGRTAEQAAAEIDLRDHSEHYPQLENVGADVRAIRRIYQLLD